MHRKGSTPGSFLDKMYLKPGELVLTEEAIMVTTVLGSCVSVTMYHPESGIAAICHAMLPRGGGSTSFKYVDTAVQHMAAYFSRRKIRRDEIQAKLFGGADMFNSGRPSVRNLTVGWQNIATANQCLQTLGLSPSATDVGGKQGRKLIFTTDTGAVFLKKLHRHELGPLDNT